MELTDLGFRKDMRKNNKIYSHYSNDNIHNIDIVEIIFHYQLHAGLIDLLDFTCNSSFNLTRWRIAWRLIKNRAIRLGMCRVNVPRSHFVQTTAYSYTCVHCVRILAYEHCVSHAASSICWLTMVVLQDSWKVCIDLGLT